VINKYLYLLIFIFLASHKAFSQSLVDWENLPIEKKMLVLQEYKQFLFKHETFDPLNASQNISEGEFTTYFKRISGFVIHEAWANDLEKCLIGGWPSYRNPSTKSCDPPFESENYPKDVCPSNKIACNPTLFGENLCSPYTTSNDKITVFKNCEKQFKAEKRDMKQVAENVDPLSFKQMTENVDEVCNDTKTVQSKTGMCTALKNKLEEWVPNETLNSQGLINKALRSKDIDDLIRAQEANHREIENNTAKFEANCEPEITEVKQQLCENLSAKIVKASGLAERLGALMDAHQFEQPSCGGMQTSEVDALVNSASSVVNQPSCSQATKTQNSKQCGAEIACATISSMPLVSVVGDVMGSSCVNSKNSCLTHLITQCVKTFVSNMGDMWDMLKSGAKWVGKKAGEFWDYITGAEDTASNKQHQIDKMNEQDQKSFLDDPVGYMKAAMNEIWEGTKEYLKNDIFCGKWSGSIPRTGTCIEPAKDFECMSCKQMIEGSCAAMGVIVAEVVPAFVGGFALSAVAKGQKAGSLFLKSIKAADKVGKITNKVSKLSDVSKFTKYGAKVFSTTWKHTKEYVDLTKKSIASLKKSLSTIKKHKSYEKIVEVAKKAKDKTTKVVSQGYDASVGKVVNVVDKGYDASLGKVVKVMDKADEAAFKAGSQTADATLGSIVKTERAVNAVDAISDSARLPKDVNQAPETGVAKTDNVIAPLPEPKKEPLLLMEKKPTPEVAKKIEVPTQVENPPDMKFVSELETKSTDELLTQMKNNTETKVIPKTEELNKLQKELDLVSQKTPADYINEYKAKYPKESKQFSDDQINKWGEAQAKKARTNAESKVSVAQKELNKINEENDIIDEVYKKKIPKLDPVAAKEEEIKILEKLASDQKALIEKQRTEMWDAEIEAEEAAKIAKNEVKTVFDYDVGNEKKIHSRKIDKEIQINAKMTSKEYIEKKQKFESSKKSLENYEKKIANLKGEAPVSKAVEAPKPIDLNQTIASKEKLKKEIEAELFANTQRKLRVEKNKGELYEYMKKNLDRADDPDVQKKMAKIEEEMIKLDKKEKVLDQRLGEVKKTPEEETFLRQKELEEIRNEQKDMDKKIADAKWEMERREIEVKEKSQKFKEMDDKISQSWQKNQELRGYKNQKEFAEQDLKKAKNDYETLKKQSERNLKTLEKEGSSIAKVNEPAPRVMLSTGNVSTDDLIETSFEMKVPNKPDMKVSAINAKSLPDNHPLKSQLLAMEKQGVSVVIAPKDAKFLVSYGGEQSFKFKDPKTGEMREVKNHIVTIKQEVLENPQSAKKLLAHEMGHKKTFTNNSNYQNSFAQAEVGEQLPYRNVAKDHKYVDFAAADESHQYFKQGYRELRQNGVPESKLQMEFKKNGQVDSEMIFGKEGVDNARWTFGELKEFSHMEQNAHKLASKQFEVVKDKPIEILNSINEYNRLELKVDQSGYKFKKSFSIDEKKYPDLASAKSREKILEDYEKKRVEVTKKFESEYKDELNDPYVRDYIKRQSVKEAELELYKQYPSLQTFSENFADDLTKRSNQFGNISKTTDEVNELILKYKNKKINYQEYHYLRQRLGEINRELRP
jgi:hypothetical protein